MTLNRANIIKLNDDDDDDDNKIKKVATLEAKVKTKKLDDKIKSEILREEIKRGKRTRIPKDLPKTPKPTPGPIK